jgi:hypothetical protein
MGRLPSGAALVCAAVLSAACDTLSTNDTQGCPVESHSPSDSYQLSYRLTSPEPCPATLSDRAQLKEAAARIVDHGAIDVYGASIEVDSRVGTLVGYEITDFFHDAATGDWSATPAVRYRAGTALPQSPMSLTPEQINQEYDRGIFEAWRDRPEMPGNPQGTVRITYRASGMYANVIAGTRVPLRNVTESWQASAGGGVAPYSYAWYRDGVLVGSNATYTANAGISDFELRAEITDAGGNKRTAVALIDVDGIATSVQGPTSVYAPDGGTWQAVSEGGYAPYAVDWFVSDDGGMGTWVGSGATWTGYPGEGRHSLRVRVTDAHGTTSIASLDVAGLGGGDGGCQPTPPALTCGP